MDDNIPVVPAPVKKPLFSMKVVVPIVLSVIFVAGLATTLILVRQRQETRSKAFTMVTTPSTDTCNLVEISASDTTSCPPLPLTGPGQNPISTYRSTFTIKNITADSHLVNWRTGTNFCTEPYGQSPGGVGPVCLSSQILKDGNATIAPGQSVQVVIERSSDN